MNKNFVTESVELVKDIISVVVVNLQDEMERQIIAAYIFGMLHAKAIQESVSPLEVQAIMIRIGIEELGYSPDAATQMTQFVIDATDREFHPTVNAIIHRGIEAFRFYVEGETDLLKEDFDSILKAIREN